MTKGAAMSRLSSWAEVDLAPLPGAPLRNAERGWFHWGLDSKTVAARLESLAYVMSVEASFILAGRRLADLKVCSYSF
jgi:hypothetical protein